MLFKQYLVLSYRNYVRNKQSRYQDDDCCCCSVAHSCLTLCDPMDCNKLHFPVHHYLPELAQNSCPLSGWCHPSISFSAFPFFSCLQSFPALGYFSESTLHIRWPKYWSFSFRISPSNEYSELISFRIDCFDLAVQETLKSLFQHHSLKASIFCHSVFFIVQLSCPYNSV